MKTFLSAILLCTFLNSGLVFAENQINDFNLRSLQAIAPAKQLMPAGRRTIPLAEMLTIDAASQFARTIVSIGGQQVLFEPNVKPIIKGASAYIYLQFTNTPSASQLTEIQAMGIEMSSYLKGNTWIAKIPIDAVDTLHTKPFVHALADILPQDKMSLKVFQEGFSKRSMNSDETHSVLVTLRTRSDEQALADLIASYQGNYQKIDRNQFLVTIADASLAQFIQETIIAWVDDVPLDAISENSDSGTRNGSSFVHNTYSLRGENVRLGLWDGGDVQIHNDLNDNLGMDRVNHVYGGQVSYHATHVAGTMIGNGSSNAKAIGMAPKASLWSYKFRTPLEGMVEAVANYDIHSANHSWGYPVGWTYYSNGGWIYGDDQQTFGEYGIKAQQWDQAVVDTDLVMAVSAGNDRNEKGNATADQPADYAHLNGYDTIPNFKNAKNVITVGSVDKSDMSSAFSNWGPSDDGRIKPDLVAIGTNVFSTDSASPSSYASLSGTSMSTPAVSAIAGLVREHYESTLGLDASAAMVKAILIQTAEDMGRPGPDYKFGWGMVRADNAIHSIETNSLFTEGEAVYLGQAFVHTFDVTSTDNDVKVTLAWTDIPAAPFSAKTLINDFNLELVDPNGVVHLPWVLGGLANPEQNATRGVNTVDNVEQVVAAPVVGEWEIRIYTNALEPGTSQAYSVVNNGYGATATCSDYIDTNQNHERQGRAYSESTTEGQVCFGTFCWGGTTVSTWYANGSNANLGTSGTTETTLHSFSTAPDTFLAESCPVIKDVAPVITLNGLATIQLIVGGNYVEQGASATDDTDGDITHQITQTGTVDTNTVGTYYLTYSVTDTAGNQSSIVRTVEVTSAITDSLVCELDSIANHLTTNRVKVMYTSLYYSTDAAQSYLGSTYVNANDVISMQEVVTGGWAKISACP